MSISRRQFVQSASAGAMLATLGQQVMAQAQIENLKIVTGFAPGGTSDTTCRRVATRLTGSYAKTAVVENRTGAGGQIAIQFVKGQPGDGATMLQTPTSMLTIYPHIYKKLSYDPATDLSPVSLACVFDFGFAIGPLVPASVKTINDFVTWAKANPAQANFGSPAAGSTPHFVGALLGMKANIELKHAAYRGTQPALQDMMGGQIAAVNELRRPFQEACTPGYFNAEGRAEDRRSAIGSGIYFPSTDFFRMWAAWRAQGDFAGLTVT